MKTAASILMLSGPEGRCYVEVKSVTLVEAGTALFPDAPTERGRKHVKTLQRAKAQGHRAVVIFVVQRPDAHSFSPNVDADPRFAEALRAAITSGVEVLAYGCTVSQSEVELSDPLPVQAF